MKTALILFLCWPSMLLAQFTLTSGTVTDPQGFAYENGTITPTLVISGSPRFASTGFPYSPPTQPTALDSKGSFAIQLGDVNQLLPAGGTWSFHICSAAGTVQPGSPITGGPVCFDLKGVVVTGSMMDITAQIEAVPPPSLTSLGGGSLLPPTCTTSSSGFFCPTISTNTLLANTAVDVSNLGVFAWCGANCPTALDTGFSRPAAGTIALGNGTFGNTSGSLQLTNITFPNSVVTTGKPNITFPLATPAGGPSCANPNLLFPQTNFPTQVGIYGQYPGVFNFCQTLTNPSAQLNSGWRLGSSQGMYGWTTSTIDATAPLEAAFSAFGGNGYSIIDAGNGTPQNETGMLRSGNIQRLTGAPVVIAGTTPTTLFSWTALQVGFNISWIVDCHIIYSPSTTANNLVLYVNFGFAPVNAAFTARIYTDFAGTSASGTNTLITTSGSSVVLTGPAPSAAGGPFEADMWGIFETTSAQSGTFAVQAATSSGGNIILLRDLAYCRVQ